MIIWALIRYSDNGERQAAWLFETQAAAMEAAGTSPTNWFQNWTEPGVWQTADEDWYYIVCPATVGDVNKPITF